MIMQTGNFGTDILTLLLMIIPGIGFIWIIGDWNLLLNFWIEYGALTLVANLIVLSIVILGVVLIFVPEVIVSKIFGIILLVQGGIIGLGLTIGFFGMIFGAAILALILSIFGGIALVKRRRVSKCDCIGQANCECA